MPYFQIAILLFAPYLLTKLTYHFKTQNWLSPILLCYALGIVLANIPNVNFNQQISKTASEATILLAIPLLLFTTDLKGWFRYAKSTILSFGLCVFSGVLMSILMGIIFKNEVNESWKIAGMMTGFFTGGAPNMNAIGIGLQAEESLIVYLNAADIICGGLLLIFLTSVAHQVLGLFLADFQGVKNSNFQNETNTNKENIFINNKIDIFKSVSLAILILAASVGLIFLITSEIKSASLIILLLTTLSILASFSKKIRHLKGSFEMGEYLLYIFSIAIGLMANFGDILAESSSILTMMFGVMYGTFLLHLLLCYFLKIDRDTALVTAVASIYGPAFVGQVASVIGNRQLLFSGMATGLVGYAIGNFLGIGVAELLRFLT